jgi:O-antigen/teichoic acid export membrane protein
LSLKKLAGQTMWYGVSNIAARLLTFLLTPYLTRVMIGPVGQLEFGKQSLIYVWLPLLNTLFTYGMETAFFRYSSTEKDRLHLYRTQLTALLFSTSFFVAILLLFQAPVASFVELADRAEYIVWCAAIIGLDTMLALPFARLRLENRPRKYALIKLVGILTFVGTIYFLFSFGSRIVEQVPGSKYATWHSYYWGVGFIIFANLLQCLVQSVCLISELNDYRPVFDRKLFKKVFIYGLPILIAGFAGNINDTLNRWMFTELYPASKAESIRQVGIFTATVRLAIMISLAIQAFRMAAEPFFFSISKDKNAPGTYARVMKWFVIVLTLMFLNVTLFLDIWQGFIGAEYREALDLVPVLLFANIFLGIYYNLTVWYKLTDRTHYGAYIMVIGAVITIAFNWLLIPVWGYAACAWGMLVCYGSMMLISYIWGQKYYPIPYNVPKLAKYLIVMFLLFVIQWAVFRYTGAVPIRLTSGAILFCGYLLFIYKEENAELKTFPFIGKYIK